MAYSFQVFTHRQTISHTHLNTCETNVRDHQHGIGSINAQMGARVSVSSRTSITAWHSTWGVLELDGGGIMSQRGGYTDWIANAYYNGSWRTMVGSQRPALFEVRGNGDIYFWRANSAATTVLSGGTYTDQREFYIGVNGTIIGTGTAQGAGTFVNPGVYYRGTKEWTPKSLSILSNSIFMMPTGVYYVQANNGSTYDRYWQGVASASWGASGTIKTIGGSGSGADFVCGAFSNLPSDCVAIRARIDSLLMVASHNVYYTPQWTIINFGMPQNSSASLPTGSVQFPHVSVGETDNSAQLGVNGGGLQNTRTQFTELTMLVQSGSTTPMIAWLTRSTSLFSFTVNFTVVGYYRTWYGA